MESLSIIKIGGSILENDIELDNFLKNFAMIEGKKILVHGGGKEGDKWLKKMGIKPNFVNGRRITDKETIDVVTSIYGGLINKKLTSKLQKYNDSFIGLSGIDGNITESEKRKNKKIDFGFVGDIKKINLDLIYILLDNNYTPIISPLTHNKRGQVLNINADTISTQIACSLAEKFKVSLFFCFELMGVLKELDDSESVIELIDFKLYKKLVKKNILSKGMIPKLENAFKALKSGVENIFIGLPQIINKKNKIKYTKIIS